MSANILQNGGWSAPYVIGGFENQIYVHKGPYMKYLPDYLDKMGDVLHRLLMNMRPLFEAMKSAGEVRLVLEVRKDSLGRTLTTVDIPSISFAVKASEEYWAVFMARLEEDSLVDQDALLAFMGGFQSKDMEVQLPSHLKAYMLPAYGRLYWSDGAVIDQNVLGLG